MLSKGLITLKGVAAQWNQVRYGSLDDGWTIYETNQPDWGGVDEMTFLYTSGNPVSIVLRSLDEWSMFQPIVELVDENGDVVSADSNTDGDGIWTSVFNSLSTFQNYTIRVLYDDTFSNGFGKYSLSVNDPDELNPIFLGMVPYWIIPLSPQRAWWFRLPRITHIASSVAIMA